MKLYTTILMLLLLKTGSAQSIERKFVGVNGSTLVNGGYQLSYSIGEVAVQSYQKGYDVFLTEGFQQAYVAKTGGLLVGENWVSAYPNPAIDFVRLDVHAYKFQANRVRITDVSGKIVLIPPFEFGNGSITVNVSGLPAGMYIISVTDPVWNNSLSTKIVKENK